MIRKGAKAKILHVATWEITLQSICAFPILENIWNLQKQRQEGRITYVKPFPGQGYGPDGLNGTVPGHKVRT